MHLGQSGSVQFGWGGITALEAPTLLRKAADLVEEQIDFKKAQS